MSARVPLKQQRPPDRFPRGAQRAAGGGSSFVSPESMENGQHRRSVHFDDDDGDNTSTADFGDDASTESDEEPTGPGVNLQ